MPTGVGERAWYIDDHADEVLPCAATLEGWAGYLATLHTETAYADEPIEDGATFSGGALLFHADIIATRTPAGWTLDRQPAEDDFVAVRYGDGLGWSAENIVYPEGMLDPVTKEYRNAETMGEALLRWLAENDELCDDVEHVAIARSEDWTLTFHRTDPPRLTAERNQ